MLRAKRRALASAGRSATETSSTESTETSVSTRSTTASPTADSASLLGSVPEFSVTTPPNDRGTSEAGGEQHATTAATTASGSSSTEKNSLTGSEQSKLAARDIAGNNREGRDPFATASSVMHVLPANQRQRSASGHAAFRATASTNADVSLAATTVLDAQAGKSTAKGHGALKSVLLDVFGEAQMTANYKSPLTMGATVRYDAHKIKMRKHSHINSALKTPRVISKMPIRKKSRSTLDVYDASNDASDGKTSHKREYLQLALRAPDSAVLLQRLVVTDDAKGKQVVKKQWFVSDILQFDLVTFPEGDHGHSSSRSTKTQLGYGFSFSTHSKTFFFAMHSLRDRNILLWNLWQLHRCIAGTPPMTSLDMLALVQSVKSTDAGALSEETADKRFLAGRRFGGLSLQEERDLEALLNEHSMGSHTANIDALERKLASQVEDMQALNTERLMAITAKENSRAEIGDDIGDAEFHLANVESWLGYYDSQLKDMKQYIQHLEDRNNEMNIVSRNQSAIVDAVEGIFDKLQLNYKAQLRLEERQTDFSGGLAAIGKYDKAALALEEVFKHTVELPTYISEMRAVKEQRASHQQLLERFSLRICANVSTHLSVVSSEYVATIKTVKSLKRPKSSKNDEMLANVVHKAAFLIRERERLEYEHLSMFGNLVQFLFAVAPQLHEKLRNEYREVMQSGVKKQIKNFVSTLRRKVVSTSRSPAWRSLTEKFEPTVGVIDTALLVLNPGTIPMVDALPEKCDISALAAMDPAEGNAKLELDLSVPVALRYCLIPLMESVWDFFGNFFIFFHEHRGVKFSDVGGILSVSPIPKSHAIMREVFQAIFDLSVPLLSDMIDECLRHDPMLVLSVLVQCDRIVADRRTESESSDGVFNSVLFSILDSAIIAPSKAGLNGFSNKWIANVKKTVMHDYMKRDGPDDAKGTTLNKLSKTPLKGVQGVRKEMRQTMRGHTSRSPGVLPFIRELLEIFGSFIRAIAVPRDALPSQSPTRQASRHEFTAIVAGMDFPDVIYSLYREIDNLADVSARGRDVCNDIADSFAVCVMQCLRKFIPGERSSDQEPIEANVRAILPQKHKKNVRIHLLIALENFYACSILFESFSNAFPKLRPFVDLSQRLFTSSRDCYLRYLLHKTFTALCEFFDGIQAVLVSSRIPKTDIPYQQKFSSAALKTVVTKFCEPIPVMKCATKAAKQLRQELSPEATWPRGRRNLLPEGSHTLLTEIWHAFVIGLLRRQYDAYDSLAVECYPDLRSSNDRVLPELDVEALLALITGAQFRDSDDETIDISRTNFSDSE